MPNLWRNKFRFSIFPAILNKHFTVKHLYIFLVIICFLVANCLPAQTLYVSGAAGNDNNNGSTWGKAYKTLSKALQIANNNAVINTILVTTGVYYPAGSATLSAQNKDSSFAIARGGLKIIGGFNPKTHQQTNGDSTILMGNNCYHVVIIAGLTASADSVVLSNLAITGGFANGSGNKNYNGLSISARHGAGIFLSNNANAGKLLFKNCVIINNYASEGGGLYTAFSSPSIINCIFIGNKVNNLGGAAIFNEAGSPQIIGCDFRHNGEGMFGGAIYNIVDNITNLPIKIANCNFADNIVDQWGAGIYAQGGVFHISNCTFSGNESFSTHESTAGGGGIYFIEAKATITNSTFCGNKVAYAAGAGIFSEKSQLIISNCTFSGNNAKYGGALCGRGNQSDIKIYNSILYGNSSCIDKYGNGSISVNYSIVDGGYNGSNNYASNPMFVNAPTYADAPFCYYKGGHAQFLPYDYRLKPGSQAIDTGNNNFYTLVGGKLTDYDLSGTKRFLGNSIDIGAYEFQNAEISTTSNAGVTKTVLTEEQPKPANK